MVDTREDLSWPELIMLGFLMGLVLIASWVITLVSWLASPSFWVKTDRSSNHQWNSRKDFRQSGLQPQPRDWYGIIIAITIVVAVIATLINLRPQSFWL